MNYRDYDLLEDMLEYAQEAVEIVGSRAVDELLADRIRYLASCRCVEIVGEAASKVSAEGRQSLPEIAWRKAINMRNILIHDYGRIEADIIVETVRNDLPKLITDIKRLLAENPPP